MYRDACIKYYRQLEESDVGLLNLSLYFTFLVRSVISQMLNCALKYKPSGSVAFLISLFVFNRVLILMNILGRACLLPFTP